MSPTSSSRQVVPTCSRNDEQISSDSIACSPMEMDTKYAKESQENGLVRAEYEFETTKGIFRIRAYRALAPNAFDRFRGLVNERFYTNTSVYRKLTGFGAQFGVANDLELAKKYDVGNNASVGSIIKSESEEVLETTTSNKRGWVAFGTSLSAYDDNEESDGDEERRRYERQRARTAEIFINLRDNSDALDSICIPFAEVTDGIEIVDKLYAGYGEMKDYCYGSGSSSSNNGDNNNTQNSNRNETEDLGFKCEAPSRAELYETVGGYQNNEYEKLDVILSAKEISMTEKGSLIEGRDGAGAFYYFVLSCTIMGFLACFFRMHVVNRRRKTVTRRASKYTAYVSDNVNDLSQLHQTLREQFASANEGVSVDIQVESEKLKSRIQEQMDARRNQQNYHNLELEDNNTVVV
jgi:cyclophilin family peptidyl-prolyl cis-trans isomerase